MRSQWDDIMAFVTGDLAATAMLYVSAPDLFELAGRAGVKLAVVLASGFFGGLAGMLGKHVAQRVIDRWLKVALVTGGLGLTVWGCRSGAEALERRHEAVSDSVGVRVEERWVRVEVPGDTVVLEGRCPEGAAGGPGETRVRSGRAEGRLRVQGGLIRAEVICAGWRDSVRVRDRVVERLRRELREAEERKPVRVVPRVYRWAMMVSVGVMGVLAGWLAWQVMKRQMRL